VTQLITDFGRTNSLISSSRLHAQAEEQNSIAANNRYFWWWTSTFYNALQSKALLKVAEQTVVSRQLFADQVNALTHAKLKSEIDLSFANVNLAQAKLLLLDAQNNQRSVIAALNAVPDSRGCRIMISWKTPARLRCRHRIWSR